MNSQLSYSRSYQPLMVATDSMQSTCSHQQPTESILVMERQHLFPEGAWQGIRSIPATEITQRIERYQQFLPRAFMEQDPRYKQIIPYIIFEYNNHYFLMQRAPKISETRLQNKFSLGIGGHVRQEDIVTGGIFAWARREFHEEVIYTGGCAIEFLGLLNDDSNDVGKVHAGLVLLLKGQTGSISIRSELASGALVSLQECAAYYDRFETWSQMVVDYLVERAKIR